MVKTFYQPHLIPKHLTGPEVPNWSSWASQRGARKLTEPRQRARDAFPCGILRKVPTMDE